MKSVHSCALLNDLATQIARDSVISLTEFAGARMISFSFLPNNQGGLGDYQAARSR